VFRHRAVPVIVPRCFYNLKPNKNLVSKKNINKRMTDVVVDICLFCSSPKVVVVAVGNVNMDSFVVCGGAIVVVELKKLRYKKRYNKKKLPEHPR
jgi:hypothetical protein